MTNTIQKSNFYYPLYKDIKNNNGISIYFNKNSMLGNRRINLVDNINYVGRTYITSIDGFVVGYKGYISIPLSKQNIGTQWTVNIIRDVKSITPFHLYSYGGGLVREYQGVNVAVNIMGITFTTTLAGYGKSITVTRDGLVFKLWIDGVYIGQETSTFSNSDSILTTVGHPALNYDCEYKKIVVYNRVLSDVEIEDNRNSYASEIIFYDDFRYDTSDGTNITPIEWNSGTGSYKIIENSGIGLNNNALECTAGGTISHSISDTAGSLSIEYYDGTNRSLINDTISNAISTYSWLSYSSGIITYTLTIGDIITKIKYTKG